MVLIQRLRSCNLLVYCNTNQTQSVTTKYWKSYKIRLETENNTENDEILNTAGVNSASGSCFLIIITVIIIIILSGS